MAKEKRTAIHKNTERELLFKNDMACCVCRESKGVIIHHIDGNPSNNSLNNLAVLCQEHHDKAHSKNGLTKNLSPEIIKKYKNDWELFIRKKRSIKISPLHSKSGIEKVLFEFEIRKTTYELLSIDDNDTLEIQQKIDFLYNLKIHEGYTSQILDAIENVAFTASFQNNKIAIIAESLQLFLYHLGGPGDGPIIKKEDLLNLYKILKILNAIATNIGKFNKNSLAMDCVLSSFDFLMDLSIWYDLKNVKKKILGNLDDIIKNCKEDLSPKDKFNSSIKKLDNAKNEFKNRSETRWGI